jgi:hypothetical protein
MDLKHKKIFLGRIYKSGEVMFRWELPGETTTQEILVYREKTEIDLREW